MGSCASQKKKSQGIIAVESVEKLGLNNYNIVHANNKRFIDEYKVDHSLGSGSYGEVRKVVHKLTEQERAVKLFIKAENDEKTYHKVKKEIEVLRCLHHPSIIKIYEFFEDDKRIYIILEKCDGGELFDMITQNKFLGENVAAIVSKQIFSAAAYMHSQGIVHRDLKPENILLEETQDYLNLKIIDFGTACRCSTGTTLTEIVGSPFYLSPEVVNNSYGPECDVWSCGVILYILLSGYPPFDGKNNLEIFNKIKKMQFDFNKPVWAGVSELAKDLIRKLLQPAKSRISALEALNHPWIRSQGSSLTPRLDLIASLKQNLQEFNSRNKLHGAITAFISSQVISNRDTKHIREAFKALDINSDGKISKDELAQGLAENPELVLQIMHKVDTDQNGFIDLDEFIQAAISESVLLSKENLKKAFDMFDLDSSGKISFVELQTVLGVGLGAGKKIWEDIMKQKRHQNDDEMSFEEFCAIIMKSSL